MLAESTLLPETWRILITGVTSIHGWPIYQRLCRLLVPSQLQAIRPPKQSVPDQDHVMSLCITDRSKLLKIRDSFRPTHVVHCAGVCDLDVCEERPEWAREMNEDGAKAVAELFGGTAYIMYMSTDLVFSGATTPKGGYAEHHPIDPVSVAGRTFVLAEKQIRSCKRHCIIRLGLPLGDSISGAKGAVDWIEKRFKKQMPVTLFHDEFRSCIRCNDLGERICQALSRELEGLFHLGGERSWSLYEIGEYVLKKGNYSPKLLKGMNREDEENGPPRIGDVSLNSDKINQIYQRC